MSKNKVNIMYNLLYQVLILVLPLITAPYLSRVLGVEGTGTYSYVLSVAYYFNIVILLGLANYGNRSIAKVKDDRGRISKTFWSIYMMQLIIGVIVIFIYLLYVFFILGSHYKLYFIAFMPYVMSAVIDINWLYFGLSDFKFTTLRSTIVKLLSLIMIFLFVNNENDLISYFIIMGGTFLLSNILLWSRVKRHTDFYLPKIKEIVFHIKPNIILFIPILALSVYRVMDKIMIKEIANVTENGYYENADKIITMALTGFSAVATVMMPSVSSMVAQGKKEKIKFILRDTMQISMFIAFGMFFGLVSIGKVFAPIFYGKQFYESGILIQLLAITVILSGWKSVLRSQYIIPFEKDKAYIISLVAGAVVNIICNLYFIPIYKARGAVIGTIAAEITGFIIQTALSSKEIDIKQLLKDSSIFIMPGLIMTVLVTLFLNNVNQSIFTLCSSIAIGAVSYSVLCIFILLIFDKKRASYLYSQYFKLKKIRK